MHVFWHRISKIFCDNAPDPHIITELCRPSKTYSVRQTGTAKFWHSCGRRTDVVGVHLTTYPGYLFLSHFRQLPLHLMELNQTLPHVQGRDNMGWLYMPKFWGVPSKNWRPKNSHFPSFSTPSQLNGNFNSAYLWNGTQYRQSWNGSENYERSSAICQITGSAQMLKNRTADFTNPLSILDSASYQASHTVNKCNSTKLC